MHIPGELKLLLLIGGPPADFLYESKPVVDTATMLSGYLAVVLGVSSGLILVLQYLLARRASKFALYDKRYPVYSEVTDFVFEVSKSGGLSYERLRTFAREARDKEFLFGEDVSDFLSSLYNNGFELVFANEDFLIAESSQDYELRKSSVRRITDGKNWFRQQRKEIKPLFDRYLRICRKYRLGVLGAVPSWMRNARLRAALSRLHVPTAT
jgi:hypothetical protein